MVQLHGSGLRKIEDILGPGEGRFLGSGYQAVGRSLRGAINPEGGFEGVGHASYLTDWSLDSSGAPRQPHLSSVDVVAFGSLAIDLACGRHGRLYIDQIALKAGSAPYLQLDDIPVRVTATTLRPEVEERYTHSVVVGNMLCNIGTRGRLRSDISEETHVAGETTDDGSGSVYGDLFALQRYQTWISPIRHEENRLHARHDFEPPEAGTGIAPRGLDAHIWPSVTMVDYIVVFGQLAQVLLAGHLGLDRTRGELWVRSVTITRPEVHRVPVTLNTVTRIVKVQTIERGKRVMHNVTIRGECGDGTEVDAAIVFVETR